MDVPEDLKWIARLIIHYSEAESQQIDNLIGRDLEYVRALRGRLVDEVQYYKEQLEELIKRLES